MARNDYAGVETVLKDTYLGFLNTIPQQKSTRLFNGFQSVNVDGRRLYIDGIAPVSYRIDNSVNADSQATSASMFRRYLTTDRMIIEIDYDENQFRQTTEKNPAGLISAEMMKATYRFLDKLGINAAVASIGYGVDGSSTLTFAQDGGTTIDATAGITDALLRKISHRLTGVEAIEAGMMGGVQFCMSEDEHYDIAGLSPQYTSMDYVSLNGTSGFMNGYQAVRGMRVVSFGAQVETGKMLAEASSIRDCLALAPDALIFGQAQGVNFEIVPLKESKISTVRLRLSLIAGAVRTDGKRTIKFQTTIKDTATFYSS